MEYINAYDKVLHIIYTVVEIITSTGIVYVVSASPKDPSSVIVYNETEFLERFIVQKG